MFVSCDAGERRKQMYRICQPCQDKIFATSRWVNL